MKKAYIFLMDGIFAMVILMIGFLIISSNNPGIQTHVSLDVVSENVIDILSRVKINNLCTNCYCSNEKLSEFCSHSLIKNQDQTILDYFGELYFTNNKEKAREIFLNITDELFRQDLYGFDLKINDEVIFSGDKDKSKNLISRKKLIFGYYEVPQSGEVEFWGPYLLEVQIWEK